MNRYACTCAALAVGLAICLLAPVAWRLVGAFCIGGGCYAIIEGLKLSRIEREIERYERPQGGAQPSPWRRLGVLLPLQEVRDLFRLTRSSHRPSGVAGWHSLLPPPRVKGKQPSSASPSRRTIQSGSMIGVLFRRSWDSTTFASRWSSRTQASNT